MSDEQRTCLPSSKQQINELVPYYLAKWFPFFTKCLFSFEYIKPLSLCVSSLKLEFMVRRNYFIPFLSVRRLSTPANNWPFKFQLVLHNVANSTQAPNDYDHLFGHYFTKWIRKFHTNACTARVPCGNNETYEFFERDRVRAVGTVVSRLMVLIFCNRYVYSFYYCLDYTSAYVRTFCTYLQRGKKADLKGTIYSNDDGNSFRETLLEFLPKHSIYILPFVQLH